MKCYCLNCGKLFVKDEKYEFEVFNLIGKEAPLWFKKAAYHAIKHQHEVTAEINVLGEDINLSVSMLAENTLFQMGMTREQFLWESEKEGINDEV